MTHQPFAPTGFPDDFDHTEYQDYLRAKDAEVDEDADADLRCALAEAEQKGWQVYRLSCDGFPDTYEAASSSEKAWPRARNRGWANGGGIVTTTAYAQAAA